VPAGLATAAGGGPHGSAHGLSEVGVRAVQVTQLQPWGRSYESILLALELDGRFYVEGDGSFVVCGHQPSGPDNRQVLWLGDDASLVTVAATPGWRPANQAAPASVVWRIEGNLFAGTEELDYATVNGYAPWSEWERLMQMLAPRTSPVAAAADDAPATDLVVQLHRFGQYIRLTEPPGGVS
jgi:hypothetical protein